MSRKLKHSALLYLDTDHFASRAAAFLREGTDANEIVLAVTTPSNLQALKRELGPDSSAVEFGDSEEFMRSTHDTFIALEAFVRDRLPKEGRPGRAVVEAIWKGREADDTHEWMRFESVIDTIFSDAALSIMCTYDVSSTPRSVLDSAFETHTSVDNDTAFVSSKSYLGTDASVDALERSLDLSPPPSSAETIAVADADLASIRSIVSTQAHAAGLSTSHTYDVLLVTNEIVSNLARHSEGGGRLSTWTDGRCFLVELRDERGGRPSSTAGYVPAGEDGGWGWRLVRQLADVAQVSTRGGHSAIRVGFDIDRPS